MTNPGSPAAADQPAVPDAARQTAVATALAATIAVNALANTLPINGQTTGEIANRFPIPITPPPYVFSIWGLIYSGMLTYTVYQALPGQRANPRLRRIAWPFVASCAANVAWLLLWHHNRYRLNLLAMVALLISLLVIDRRLDEEAEERSAAENLLVRQPFNIYLAWICVATIVNATATLYDTGWQGHGLDKQAWTAGLLSLGAALGAAMGVGRRDPAFPLVIAWAFAGIAQKQRDQELIAPVALAATGAALLAALGALWRARM